MLRKFQFPLLVAYATVATVLGLIAFAIWEYQWRAAEITFDDTYGREHSHALALLGALRESPLRPDHFANYALVVLCILIGGYCLCLYITRDNERNKLQGSQAENDQSPRSITLLIVCFLAWAFGETALGIAQKRYFEIGSANKTQIIELRHDNSANLLVYINKPAPYLSDAKGYYLQTASGEWRRKGNYLIVTLPHRFLLLHYVSRTTLVDALSPIAWHALGEDTDEDPDDN